MELYSALLWRTSSVKRSDIAHDNKGITQFYLPPTHEQYLPLLQRIININDNYDRSGYNKDAVCQCTWVECLSSRAVWQTRRHLDKCWHRSPQTASDITVRICFIYFLLLMHKIVKTSLKTTKFKHGHFNTAPLKSLDSLALNKSDYCYYYYQFLIINA